MNVEDIIFKLKKETNNIEDIIYRKKIINNKDIYIIYNEPITSSDKISDFIIRSLNNIANSKESNITKCIINNISNFKVKKLNNYEDICKYLHKGFTIILIAKENTYLALETKGYNNITRSIDSPTSENTIRGSKDAFVEDYQKNIGLIKKRIKSNDLWMENISIGKYTDTQISVVYINSVAKKELIEKIVKKLNTINISGIIDSSIIKNLIEKENKSIFPTIMTTERPDNVVNSLLEGKAAIVVDNCPFVLIIPGVLNDFIKTSEDYYAKSFNATFTRILKFITFFIALMVPGIYIALITYNQEMIPTDLLISFAIQRSGVPFPAFFEAFIMIISFEILRETNLRVPGYTGSTISIVGALILGEAAVNAGIVSPIMIIIVAITAISSLAFTEPDIINALRWYRLLFMIGASFLGIIGVVIIFIYFISKLSSIETFNVPYLYPYVPTSISGLKDSVIKFSHKKLTKREKLLSDNIIKEVIIDD